jgi:hypothetical protein
MLDEWTAAVAADLGLGDEALAALDAELLLELAAEVARSVTRPAAPLTAFLVGYAAARAGGSAIDVMAAADTARAAARRWPGRAG